MFSLFQKDVSSIGSVYYRGNLAPRPEEYAFLQKHGFEIKPFDVAADAAHWGLKLTHPKLGEGELLAIRGFKPPPRMLVDFASNLSESEKTEALAAGSGVSLKVPARRKNILRDRKAFLCFLRAVMSNDGVVAADHGSQLFWSSAALQDETSHGADVDIFMLFTQHAVTQEGDACRWLHTHGLAQIGAVDFDVINPSESLLGLGGNDAMSAIACAIVEGDLKVGGGGFDVLHPKGKVRLVDAAEFDRKAPAAERAARTPDEDHTKNRGVVCDVSSGFLGLGSSVRASRRLSGLIDETSLVHFSTAATALMADRARKTLPVLRKLSAEFAELKLPVIAKIGYQTDNGGADSQEHLWFEVHDVGETDIDATLASSPFNIKAMKAGDRGWHPIDKLTDWQIMSPAGVINPRSMTAARLIRENLDKIKEIIRMAQGAEE